MGLKDFKEGRAMGDFRALKVWQKGMDLFEQVVRLEMLRDFPARRRQGLLRIRF